MLVEECRRRKTCGVWEKSKHGLSCTVEEMYSRSREVDMESESTCSLMTDTVEHMEWECVRTQSEKQATWQPNELR